MNEKCMKMQKMHNFARSYTKTQENTFKIRRARFQEQDFYLLQVVFRQ